MKGLPDYIQGLEVSQGPLAGQPVKLLPWERRFLRGAFAPKVTTAALTLARGNGKTSLVAAIGAACLNGPLSQERGEVVIVASSFGQAHLCFEHTLWFLSPALEAAKRDWRIRDSTGMAEIEYRPLGSKLKVIGSDPRRAHGLAPALVLADEPAQWPPGSTDKMLSALLTAQGKIAGSRFVTLGTLADSPDNWFNKLAEGGADYAQVHSADQEADPHKAATWAKANPAMRAWPTLRAAIKADSDRARRDISLLPAFRALRLNLGVADAPESILLEAKTWMAAEADLDPRGPYVLGLDLGTNASQSAAAAYYPVSGSLDAFAVWPAVPNLRERARHDNAGNLYDDLAERGELLIRGTNTADISGLLAETLKRWGRPGAIVTDRWREAELRERLEESGYPLVDLETRGMGWKDGSEDVRLFQRAFLDGDVKPKPSRLLRSAMAEVRLLVDPAGNAKIDKRRHGKSRDDAVVASVLAVAEGQRRKPFPTPKRRRHSALV